MTAQRHVIFPFPARFKSIFTSDFSSLMRTYSQLLTFYFCQIKFSESRERTKLKTDRPHRLRIGSFPVLIHEQQTKFPSTPSFHKSPFFTILQRLLFLLHALWLNSESKMKFLRRESKSAESRGATRSSGVKFSPRDDP